MRYKHFIIMSDTNAWAVEDKPYENEIDARRVARTRTKKDGFKRCIASASVEFTQTKEVSTQELT